LWKRRRIPRRSPPATATAAALLATPSGTAVFEEKPLPEYHSIL